MASSAKSEKLGLSLWEPEDAPQREDFRQDNEKLEEMVGGHLSDAAQHLTATEKAYVKKPVSITFYTGTGNPKYRFTIYGPKNPHLIAIYARNKPHFVIRNGVVCQYMVIGCDQGVYRNPVGVTLYDSAVEVYQQTEEEGVANGYRVCLNEKGVIYMVVMIQ